MKKLIVVLILISFFGLTFAKQVDQNTAKYIGQTFLKVSTNFNSLKGISDLQIVYIAGSNSIHSTSSKSLSTVTYFYVFNIVNDKGFVIVSGDDNAAPILGYSEETIFDPKNIPENAAKWLEGYKVQMRYIIENDIKATDEIKNEWESIKNGNFTAKSTTSVNPLIQTKWSQSPYYNDLCPSGSLTGCVATAMAQIMKFWNYPTNGTNFHSYNHSTYGTLSANFGSTTYQWSSMPNIVSSANNAVATLMYQCGVSVNMDYGIEGSSAQTLDVANALKAYFGYSSSVQGMKRSSYSETQWKNVLKTELDAGRPLQYAGRDSTAGGHSFICDGYDVNNFFHFNWGWGPGDESLDGYFSINDLNPNTYKFNLDHRAIIGIQPPTGSQTYNLKLYNYVTPSASTITYGQSFTVTTNIVNYGANTFNGDYCIAIFDNSSIFIDYAEIKTGFSLQGGYAYANDLVFSNSGLFSMLPGTYKLGLFYKPTGGNWIQVANSGSYTNLVQLNVVYPNNIELNSSMTLTPGPTFTQGQSSSINVNVRNDGSTTFIGQYRVGLFNLDGTLAQTINTMSEINGLPPDCTYLSPYLTFTNPSITVNPGTYLLAVQHKETSGDWQLSGSTYYLNPIKVIVKEAPLLPDIFEPNNTLAQSYTIPIPFIGDSASISTTGSNSHAGTDYDFYKINLPSGYNYQITARLHDSYNSGNGNTYTLDAIFSYSTNGTAWSDAYDDVLSGNIIVNDGGTVYFLVAPYFSGKTGTYLLDLGVSRTIVTSIEKNKFSDLIKIYPNPAKDYITIDLSGIGKVNQIQILDIFGKQIMAWNPAPFDKFLTCPTSILPNGTYYLRFMTETHQMSKKIIIMK